MCLFPFSDGLDSDSNVTPPVCPEKKNSFVGSTEQRPAERKTRFEAHFTYSGEINVYFSHPGFK